MLKPLLWLLFGFHTATTGTIEVFVHVAGTTTPLSDVEVTLNTANKQKTDEMGRVVFSNLPSGIHIVRTERTGYFRKDESISSSMRPASPLSLTINISPSNWSQHISIGMVAFGSISGRVTAKDGVPLKDVFVLAGSIQYQNGRRLLDERTRVRTGANGEYHLTSLVPGDYYVRAEQPNVVRSYAGTFYPGEMDIQRATWIAVRDGDQIGGIDFVVASPRTFSISGRVLNLPRTLPDGLNASPRFALISHDADVPDSPSPVSLAPERYTEEGDFLITGIPAGSWDLLSLIGNEQTSRDPTRMFGRVQIEVVDQDVQDVVITPMASNIVIGRARMTGGEAVPISLHAMLVPRDNTPVRYLSHLTRARTLSYLDGKFEFENVPPGKYSFQFEEIPAGYYVADIRQGSRSIYDDGVFEVGNHAPDALEIVMGGRGSRIDGKVQGLPENVQEEEYGSVRVVLVPAKRQNLMLYQRATLSSVGRFSFFYIAPGEYKIFALKNLPDGAEKSSEFLRRYEALGTSVSVSSDSSVQEVLVPIIRND